MWNRDQYEATYKHQQQRMEAGCREVVHNVTLADKQGLEHGGLLWVHMIGDEEQNPAFIRTKILGVPLSREGKTWRQKEEKKKQKQITHGEEGTGEPCSLLTLNKRGKMMWAGPEEPEDREPGLFDLAIKTSERM